MGPNEAIQLIGCEQYSNYVGYADSFAFGGNCVDANQRYVSVQPPIRLLIDRSAGMIGVDDSAGLLPWTRCILPIQSISINRSILSENCSKLTSDFIRDGNRRNIRGRWRRAIGVVVHSTVIDNSKVRRNFFTSIRSTVHRFVLAIIQLIAASQARRPMIFAAYLDKKFVPEFEQVYDFFVQNKLQVRDLYGLLHAYCQSRTRLPVFQFILQTARSYLRP